MLPWLPALLAVTLAAAPAAEEGTLVDRLKSADPAERRAAAARLADVGTDAATGGLAKALRDPDRSVRNEAQAALWAIWHRSGDPAIDALLQQGIALTEQGRFPEAVAVFSDVITRAPAFAEGWNKRATVYYLMGDYDRSLADCDEVMRRNPIHFGALSGYGLIYMQKGDLEHALEYFEKALAANPNLEQLAGVVQQLREQLTERKRQMI